MYVPVPVHGLIVVWCWQVEVGWQERAPRSLSENYIEGGAEGSAAAAGSTATPKPPLARPQDVFISVKTTGHYHRARLPVIIKTWFQLAKEQVRYDLFSTGKSADRCHKQNELEYMMNGYVQTLRYTDSLIFIQMFRHFAVSHPYHTYRECKLNIETNPYSLN